jgi:soluble lytic murein transglycosylase-like protein
MTIRKSSRALLSTVFAALALTWGIGSPAAEEAEPNACRIAIRAAEVRYDLPSDLLLAMGMVESGLNPFAINIAGRPAQPDNVAEAELLLVDVDGKHYRDMTIGCMQLHARWHKANFGNRPERMLDAAANVDYAARYLRHLYEQEGSWRVAVGRYNAGGKGGRAYNRYICLVDRKLRQLKSETRLGCESA